MTEIIIYTLNKFSYIYLFNNYFINHPANKKIAADNFCEKYIEEEL